MAKYTKTLAGKIVQMIEEDEFTTRDICKILSISPKTFYTWKANKPDFAMEVDTAMENREERLRMLARKAITKKLEGYKLVETKTVYALNKNAEDEPELSVKEYVVKDKYCVPETSAIALSLKNGTKDTKAKMQENNAKLPLTIVVSQDKVKRDIEMLKNNLGTKQPLNSQR